MILKLLLALAVGVAGQIPLPPGSMPIANPKDPCVEVKEVDSMVNLPRHKYMVLEHCLYYHIQNTNDRRFMQPNSLVVLPPSNGDKTQSNVTVNVHEIVVQHAWLNDMMKDLHIRGHMKLTWLDPRVTWDENEFRIPEVAFQTASHIWVPQLASLNSRDGASVGSGDSLSFKRLKAQNGGNISAFFNFNLQGNCDVDLENYPNEAHHCCYELAPKLYEDLTVLRVFTDGVHLDERHYRRTGWALASTTTRTYANDEGISTLEFCVELRRASTTLRVELAVPMAICAVLVAISPLFGKIPTQLYVKLFALLLQYLCLEYLANKSSYIGMGNSTPRIFQFYEFTIAVNLLSIICSLIVNLLARKERKLPPGYKVGQFSAIFNTFFCCLNSASEETAATAETAAGAKSYRRDWAVVWSAVHSVLMLLVVLVYLVGLLIIYS